MSCLLHICNHLPGGTNRHRFIFFATHVTDGLRDARAIHRPDTFKIPGLVWIQADVHSRPKGQTFHYAVPRIAIRNTKGPRTRQGALGRKTDLEAPGRGIEPSVTCLITDENQFARRPRFDKARPVARVDFRFRDIRGRPQPTPAISRIRRSRRGTRTGI